MAGLNLMKGYEQYVVSKVGKEEAEKASPFFIDHHFNRACGAAQSLAKDYDVGIGLAMGGLWLEYIFNLHGFPVKTVKMHRKGPGAIWEPIDGLEEINNKKVLLLENDVVTGRTLKKACKEINKYSPKGIDLLLVFKRTVLTVKDYKAWRKKYDLPTPEEIWDHLKVVHWEEKEKGLAVFYSRGGKIVDGFFRKNKDWISMSVKGRIPKGIGKVMTLEEFKDSPEAVLRLEEILRGK